MSDNIPLVSVSVITYNHENYIKQSIESVLNQKTEFHFDVHIGDDGSDDSTPNICKEYLEAYKGKVYFYHRDRNSYDKKYIHSGRRNFVETMLSCQGKYIALMDGDDYWTDPYKLQKQVDFLEANPDYAICFHNTLVINQYGEKIQEYYSDFDWNLIERGRNIYGQEDLLRSPLCPTASVVFRRELIPTPLPEWFYSAMSGDIPLFSMVCGHRKVYYFDERWSAYRKHSGGITTSHDGEILHRSRIFIQLRLNDYFNNKYKNVTKEVITYHLTQLSSLNELPVFDLLKVFVMARKYFCKRMIIGINNRLYLIRKKIRRRIKKSKLNPKNVLKA